MGLPPQNAGTNIGQKKPFQNSNLDGNGVVTLTESGFLPEPGRLRASRVRSDISCPNFCSESLSNTKLLKIGSCAYGGSTPFAARPCWLIVAREKLVRL